MATKKRAGTKKTTRKTKVTRKPAATRKPATRKRRRSPQKMARLRRALGAAKVKELVDRADVMLAEGIDPHTVGRRLTRDIKATTVDQSDLFEVAMVM